MSATARQKDKCYSISFTFSLEEYDIVAHACSSTDENHFINGQDFRSRIFVTGCSYQ